MGYLTRKETKEALNNQQDGVFLIRFSNSGPNAISLDWKYGGSPNKPSNFVHFWSSTISHNHIISDGIYQTRLTMAELKQQGLKERIASQRLWKVHYPSSLKKEEIFNNDPTRETRKGLTMEDAISAVPLLLGYVRATLQMKLDCF